MKLAQMNNQSYFQREMKNLVSDFKLAKDEDEKWEIMSRIAELERLAMEVHSFKFADELAELKVEIQNLTPIF